jgi:hypothetical protein
VLVIMPQIARRFRARVLPFPAPWPLLSHGKRRVQAR